MMIRDVARVISNMSALCMYQVSHLGQKLVDAIGDIEHDAAASSDGQLRPVAAGLNAAGRDSPLKKSEPCLVRSILLSKLERCVGTDLSLILVVRWLCGCSKMLEEGGEDAISQEAPPGTARLSNLHCSHLLTSISCHSTITHHFNAAHPSLQGHREA